MDRYILETSECPEIVITKIDGTLRIKGWDRSQIRADMEEEDTLKANSDGNKVTITCSSGCLLRVPTESAIEIDKVLNDLVIKSVDGSIKANQVHGQVMVKNVGELSVEKAYGNFNARNIESDLTCGKISGQASIQDVDGKISLERVSGNLSIRGYASGLSARADGNATLRLEPEPDGEFTVNASGNIVCRLDAYVSATLTAKAKSGNVRVNVTGKHESVNPSEERIVIGDGDSQIYLEAGGNIDVSQGSESDDEFEFSFDTDDFSDFSTLADDISQMVSGQIETQMDTISQHINDLTSNLSNLDLHTAESTRRRMEAKRRNLERKLASVERKARHGARTAERRMAMRMNTSRRTPPSDPVSDEERQKVLQLLQDQKISVAEAEMLLAALEGQTPEDSPVEPPKVPEVPAMPEIPEVPEVPEMPTPPEAPVPPAPKKRKKDKAEDPEE